MKSPWFFFVSTGFSVVACLLTAQIANAATIVACVGDSITAGAWPGKLGTLLGNAYTTNNYGVSGTTLLKNGDSPYWNTQQFKDSHSVGPNIVVIMLGTNDSKPQNWGPHKGEYAGDYEALIDSYTALASKPRIFLNLPPPAGTNGFGISGAIIENEILPLVTQTALKKSVETIDIFAAFGGHNFDPTLYGSAGDQVHPGDTGSQRIADTVYAAIKSSPDAGAGARDAAPDVVVRIDASAQPDAASVGTGGSGGAGGSNGPGGASASGGTAGSSASSGGAGSSVTAGSGGKSAAETTPASDSSGCSCRLAPSQTNRPPVWLMALVVAVAARRRRA